MKMKYKVHPVIVIGSGLAGLSCAVRLKRQGLPVLVLEREKVPGGRLRTDRTDDGFTLDHGFQVLLNSYPELRGLLDLRRLKLRTFDSGALIMKLKEGTPQAALLANPLIHPSKAARELLSRHVPLNDQALVVKLLSLAFKHAPALSLPGEKPISTGTFLAQFGFSEKFIQTFWKPFLTGVFLDPELSLDSEYFLFLIKCFSSGRVSVPARGMAEIPQQLVTELGQENIQTGVQVRSFGREEVVLESGQRLRALQVICAYNPNQNDQDYYSVTTHYFSTPSKLPWKKWLVLVPKDLGLRINSIAVMSEIAPEYSTNGETLLSVTEVRSDTSSADIAREVQSLMRTPVSLRWIKTYQIKRALPRLKEKGQGYEFREGIYYCGDHLSSPSINGALMSGRLVAREVAQSLFSKAQSVLLQVQTKGLTQ